MTDPHDRETAPHADAEKRSAEASGHHHKLVLCPYCGFAQHDDDKRCPQCHGLFESLSRRATQISMGPWYIRDRVNPYRPGCSYPMMRKLIASGRITPTTVVRGPSTRQFWSIARNTPGLAHLLGYCYRCHAHVEPTAKQCPACDAKFRSVRQRNELGLLYPSQRQADAAQAALHRKLGLEPETPDPSHDSHIDHDDPYDHDDAPHADAEPHHGEASGNAQGDLLDDLFGEEIALLPAEGVQSVKPLDFTPAADASSQAPAPASPLDTPHSPTPDDRHHPTPNGTDAAPPRPEAPIKKPNSLVVWLLVVLNLLVAAFVIWYLLTQNR